MDTNFVVILMSGKNPITSTLVPSFVFVVVLTFILGPVINFSTDIDGLIKQGLVLLILSIVVGVFLQYINTFLYKFLEGYGILSRFPFLKNRKIKHARSLVSERDKIEEQIMRLEEMSHTEETQKQLSILKEKHYSISARYDQMYPYNIESVLPTSFGNILRAAEDYARVRYGIESVTFWRMLVGVMPKEYEENISQARSEVSFFVNCIILSILSSIVFSIVAIYHRSNIYLGGALLSLFLGILFYKASISSVLSFGEMIRGAYDLYRFDVLAKLNIQIPRNSVEEFYIWKNLGELVQLGASSLEFQVLRYRQNDELISEGTPDVDQKPMIVVSEGFSILISLLLALLAFILGKRFNGNHSNDG